jgi:hypothetical protein
LRISIVLLALSTISVHAQDTPRFDSQTFCDEFRLPMMIASASRQICLEQERIGKNHLATIIETLDRSIVASCDTLVRRHYPGGSYWLFGSCIKQMVATKAN